MTRRRVLGEGVWVIAGQAGAVLGALASVRLLTNALSPTEYGSLALGLTVATLVSQTVLGPLSGSALRFYAPAAEQGAVGHYMFALRTLAARGVAAILALAALLVVSVAIAGHAYLGAMLAFAFAFSLLAGLAGLLTAVQTAARHRAIVAFHQGVDPWARALLAVVLLEWLRPTGFVALLGYCGAAALLLCSQLVFLRCIHSGRAGTDPERRWRSHLTTYARPFMLWGAFTWCQLSSDRWALEWFASREDVGVYTALYQVGYAPIYLCTAMATQLFEPILFSRAGNATDSARNVGVARLVSQLTLIALALTVIAFAGAALLHEHLFELLVAHGYRGASSLLPWIVLSGGLFAAGQTLSLKLLSTLQSYAMLSAKIGTAVVGVACNLIGASVAGTSGVVFATLAFSATYFAWMLYLFASTSHELEVRSGAG